jgi:hypothetical protein
VGLGDVQNIKLSLIFNGFKTPRGALGQGSKRLSLALGFVGRIFSATQSA